MEIAPLWWDVGYGSHIGEKAAATGVPVFNFPPARDSYPLCLKWMKLHWDWEIYTMMGGFIQFSFINTRVKLVKPHVLEWPQHRLASGW